MTDTTTTDATNTSLIRTTGVAYFVVAFIARLPFAMMVVGVLTLVVSARDSLSLGGMNSAAVGLGTACFGPLLGAAADRFGQRPTLLVVGIANGVMLAGFAWVVYSPLHDWAVLVAAYLIGSTAPQVAPLSRARLVTIIDSKLHPSRRGRVFNSTMAYESAADETTFVVGPFVVGVLATFIAPWAPLVGASLLTFGFVTAFALHRTSPPARQHSNGSEAVGRISELFRPGLVVITVGIFAVGLFFGSTLTALTSYTDDLGQPERAGLLYGVMGIGSAALALAVALFPARFTLRARLLIFGAVMLAGTIALSQAPSTTAVVVVLGIMGFGIGPTLVTQYSFGANRSPLGRSSTVMAVLGSAIIVGQSLGAALTGEVGQRFGTGAAMLAPIVAASIIVLSAVVNWFLSAERPGAGTGSLPARVV